MKKLLTLSLLTLTTSLLSASSLEVGIGSVKFDYNEYKDDGTWLDSETNENYKVDGGFIKYDFNLGTVKEEDIKYDQKLELYYNFHINTTNYDGSLQDGTPHKSKTDNYLHQGHLRYKAINSVENYEIGLFVGLGYKYWDRDLLGSSGYLETYEWPYYEVGLSWKWYDGKFFMGIDASYQKAYKPTMYAYLDGGLDFDLGETKGHKIDIPIGYEIDEQLDVVVHYIYDIWDIEKSNILKGSSGKSWIEPSSETKNSYVYISLKYKF